MQVDYKMRGLEMIPLVFVALLLLMCFVRETTALVCDSSPCLQSGSCVDGGAVFTCNCTGTGFEGSVCQTNIDDCLSSPCNSGICTDDANGFICNCTGTGLVGSVCQTNIDDCLSSPCNSGICIDDTNAFTCNCTGTGFEGSQCQTNIDDCVSSPCNSGICIDDTNTFTCNCTGTGFEGSQCQTNIDDCVSSPCNSGICTDDTNAFMCNCTGTGFEGSQCQTNIDDCVSSPCDSSQNQEICIDAVNSYACTDACGSFPCMNAASCSAKRNLRFQCNCATGFQGELCEIDVDDCLSMPCLHGTCDDKVGNYSCNCAGTNHEGVICEVYNGPCLSMPCPGGWACIDGFNGFFTCAYGAVTMTMDEWICDESSSLNCYCHDYQCIEEVFISFLVSELGGLPGSYTVDLVENQYDGGGRNQGGRNQAEFLTYLVTIWYANDDNAFSSEAEFLEAYVNSAPPYLHPDYDPGSSWTSSSDIDESGSYKECSVCVNVTFILLVLVQVLHNYY